MVLKTFNVDADTFSKFSAACKENGLSMSKQIQFFMQSMVEEEPNVRAEYQEKLDRIRKGAFIRVDSIAQRYGLKE
jgi:hypothetical protein